MTVLDIPTIAYYWEHNGGHADAVVDAVAVVLAESGGRTDAVSPSADYGLWQINQIHLRELGYTEQQLFDPNNNAWAAIQISGNGTNWGPWCTAWIGGHCPEEAEYLADPEPGSPAGSHLAQVASTLRLSPPRAAGAPPPGVDGTADATYAWTTVQRFHNGDAVTRYKRVDAIWHATKGIRT